MRSGATAVQGSGTVRIPYRSSGSPSRDGSTAARNSVLDTMDGTVTVLLGRKEFYARQSRQYVDRSFQGSLPAFLAAFTGGRRLTASEAAELRAMIENAEEEKP